MTPTSAVGYGLFRYCQKIPQLVESKGLWDQEFLIAFHFKISSLFNKKWDIKNVIMQIKKSFLRVKNLCDYLPF